jgi:hypothetical protein
MPAESMTVVQLVRTLPRHWLASHTVTAVLLLGVIINISVLSH